MTNGSAIERRALELLEAALAHPVDERRQWIESRTDGEAEVRRRALQLLVSLDRAELQLATGGAGSTEADTELPERIGAYRIVEKIGQGGMGAVFKAERDTGDFDHLVAIKLIRPGALSPALVERFQRERQILASLSHPHIARLYDGGTTDMGEPYFVMEFIEGTPITEWADDQALSLEGRLRLLIAVCDAVGFAHQNLIVHRDLTPRNVLVMVDGTPKLIDFGIAQLQDPEAAESVAPEGKRAAQLSLTPGFAAPERYLGTPATTLSDVFSLGKLLERLAHGSERHKELEAIIARATAEDPADRYPTARALARDLERFLANYPVEAVEGGRRYVFSKFFVRNRTATLAGVGLVVALVAALTMTLIAYAQAERQRALAQRSFADTRSIARSMMFDVYDEVSRVPGSVEARLLLADTAQRYLESLAADQAADVGVRYDAAQGFFRLAEVVGARTGGGNVGETERAKQFYERARALLTQLHADHPERRDIQASLGHLLAVMADSALFSDGNFQAAKENARRSRRLLQDLPQLDPTGAGALGMTYLHEGNALAFEGRPEPAGEIYRRGLRTIRSLSPELRSSPEVRRAQAEIFRMMGAYHAYFERAEEARRMLEASLAIHRSIARDTDYASPDIYRLVTVLQAVAQMELAAGNVARADALASDAVLRARQGMRVSPNDVGPRELFTSVAILKGLVLARRGSMREAVALADEAIAMKRELTRRAGNVVSGPMTLAVRLQEASEVYLLAGDMSRACPVMTESVGIMRDYERTAELPIANRTNNLEPMLEALRGC